MVGGPEGKSEAKPPQSKKLPRAQQTVPNGYFLQSVSRRVALFFSIAFDDTILPNIDRDFVVSSQLLS